jgi:dihydrofolate reductase
MRKLTVVESVTLDGVMQAPGGAEEDTRDGFAHGGWAVPYHDAVMAEAMGRRMAGSRGPLLFGRRTYEQFATYWPHQPDDNPYAAQLNRVEKLVASTTLREPLPWANSRVLPGDAADAVAALKAEDGPDIGVLGSGVLVQALLRRGLVDSFLLLVHPLVLGTGRRLFPDGGAPAALELEDSLTTTTGVVIATLRVR